MKKVSLHLSLLLLGLSFVSVSPSAAKIETLLKNYGDKCLYLAGSANSERECSSLQTCNNIAKCQMLPVNAIAAPNEFRPLKGRAEIEKNPESTNISPPSIQPTGKFQQISSSKSPRKTSNFSIIIKSYIAKIKNRGYIFGKKRDILLGITPKLIALQKITNKTYSENPKNIKKDKKYRLFTRLSGSAQCLKNGRIRILKHRITSDSGKEGPLQAPPLKVKTRHSWGRFDKSWHFSWVARGRPNSAVEPIFQNVWPRTKRYIWHKITGSVFCDKRGRVRVTVNGFRGSKFPSHRYWIGKKQKKTINQGPFSGLWHLSDAPKP